MYGRKLTPLYTEEEHCGNPYRETYLEGIQKFIEEKRKEALKNRIAFGAQIAENREAYRRKYYELLGYPLTDQEHFVPRVKEVILKEDEKCIVSRMQFEIFDGLWLYGILLRQKKTIYFSKINSLPEEGLPLVIVQHGAGGAPELCSSFFDSANYNEMALRIFEKGMHVFAPQLDIWADSKFGSGDKRGELDNALKQVGSSIAALEIYALQRCLDYFEKQEYCNGHFGMAGLSYGGFYTLCTAAAEKRIRAALACSFFNDRTKYHMADIVWKNAANTFSDAQIGALVCPRYLRIEVGDNDNLFDAESARAEYEILKAYYKEAPDHLQFHVFHGYHEFCPEDMGVEWLAEKMGMTENKD